MAIDYLTLLLLFVFFSAILLFTALHRVFFRKTLLIDRLAKIDTIESQKEKKAESHSAKYFKLLSSVSKAAVKINLFRKIAKSADRNLTAADIPLKSEEYVLLTIMISTLAGIAAIFASNKILPGLLVMVLIISSAHIWLKVAIAKRLAKFNAQIGDALVIISNSIRSGFSFLQSMDMVRKELPSPISKEFGYAFQEMSLGISTEEALTNLNARLNSEDLDLLITAVLIQRQVGGNLAEILDNIAVTIRERVRIKGEIKTLTAQGKISGIIIGILPIILGIALSLISPDYLKVLITDPIGRAMLLTAVSMEIVGILLIKKIISIEV